MSQAVVRVFVQMDKIAERAAKEKAGTATSTGRIVQELHEGLATFVVGGPDEVRRALLLDVAAELACGGRTVVLFALGMPGLDAARRIVASAAGVELAKVRTTRGMTSCEWSRLFVAANDARKLNLHIDDPRFLVPARLARQVRRLALLAPVGTVVIDELERVRGRGRSRTSAALAELRRLAIELNVSVLAGARSVPRRASRSVQARRTTVHLGTKRGLGGAATLSLVTFRSARPTTEPNET